MPQVGYVGKPGPYIGPDTGKLFGIVSSGGNLGNVTGIKTAVSVQDLLGGGFFEIGPPGPLPPIADTSPLTPDPDFDALMERLFSRRHPPNAQLVGSPGPNANQAADGFPSFSWMALLVIALVLFFIFD